MKNMFLQPKKYKNGFTIVELLVSAVIFAIIVVSVVAVVRKGRDLQVTDQHRRQARIILHRLLENEYDYRRYRLVKDTSFTLSDTLDERDGNPLIASIVVDVDTTGIVNVQGTNIPVKKVTTTATWTEVTGEEEEVSLTKLLADAL